ALADSDEVVTEVIDWDDVVSAIDQLMKRLGWDKNRGKRHLILTYGVNSRRQLTDEQVFEFLAFLKSQSKFKAGQTAMFRGVRVVIERVINEVVAVVRSWDKPKERGYEVAIAHLSPVAS
ncbi:DNA primase, partial [Crocosphaera sp. XPORK-15E]|nr:DNA primase [Crocosphaera sp. XPORK-15E]